MLYRVRVRTTQGLRPGADEATYWEDEILYCGYNCAPARRAYHESEPHDYRGRHGDPARNTLFEVLDESGLEDDEVGIMKTTDRPPPP